MILELQNINGAVALDMSQMEKQQEIRAVLARHIELRGTSREARRSFGARKTHMQTWKHNSFHGHACFHVFVMSPARHWKPRSQ